MGYCSGLSLACACLCAWGYPGGAQPMKSLCDRQGVKSRSAPNPTPEGTGSMEHLMLCGLFLGTWNGSQEGGLSYINPTWGTVKS